MRSTNQKNLTTNRAYILFLVATMLSVLSACRKGKDGDGPGSPGNKSDDENSEVDVHYRDLPSGEVSVFSNATSIIGESNLSCYQSGYGLAVYKSKAGSQPARVCCINLDARSGNSKFISEESSKVTVKPNSCDIAVIVSKETSYDQLKFNFTEQQLVIFSDSYGVSQSNQVSIMGGSNKKTAIELDSKDSKLLLKGQIEAENLLFSKGNMEYITSQESDLLHIKNSSFKGTTLNLVDSASSSSFERKTSFEGVKIYSTEQRPSLVLRNYPFLTDGIEIVPHPKMPSYVLLTGEIYAPLSNLKQKYPVVASNVTLTKTSTLNVSEGSTLWSSLDPSLTVPMFKLHVGSLLHLKGDVKNRIKVEAFPRLDGLVKTFQDLNYSYDKGKIKLSHTDIDSVKIQVSQGITLELDDVNSEMKSDYPKSRMQSKGMTITGIESIALTGGTVKILTQSSLKKSNPNDFFAYARCGRVEGLANLMIDGKDVLSKGIPAVLVSEDNDDTVINNCSEFYRNDGKRQALHNKAIAVATSNTTFREMKSCYFTYLSGRGWIRNVGIDCHSVASPVFNNVSIVSDGHTYWNGSVTDDTHAVGGNIWTGPKSSDPIILLMKGPDGNEFTFFETGKSIQLVVPESEANDSFTLTAYEMKNK